MLALCKIRSNTSLSLVRTDIALRLTTPAYSSFFSIPTLKLRQPTSSPVCRRADTLSQCPKAPLTASASSLDLAPNTAALYSYFGKLFIHSHLGEMPASLPKRPTSCEKVGIVYLSAIGLSRVVRRLESEPLLRLRRLLLYVRHIRNDISVMKSRRCLRDCSRAKSSPILLKEISPCPI